MSESYIRGAIKSKPAALKNYGVTSCKSCGAPIVWATTTGGAAIPLDPEPADDGNVLVDTETGKATVLGSQAGYEPLERYKSHFATCPHAKRWRR